MNGRKGDTKIIHVPIGTLVKRVKQPTYDFFEDEDEEGVGKAPQKPLVLVVVVEDAHQQPVLRALARTGASYAVRV